MPLRHQQIFLFINIGWFLFKLIPTLLLKVFRALHGNVIKFTKILIVLLWAILLIVFYAPQYIALLVGAALALMFAFIADKLITMPKPRIIKPAVIPKKIVITHIYISTKMTHEAVSQAIQLIKEAINEIEGTGEEPQVSLSAFKPGAFDIVVKYTVLKAEIVSTIKEKVNINIIKKLNENNIELSGSVSF